ncbi:hypothetical protein D3C72_425860 [compost metagenome]
MAAPPSGGHDACLLKEAPLLRVLAASTLLVGLGGLPALAATDPMPGAPRVGLPLTIAYFGETVTHPGLLVGTEHKAWEAGWHRAFLAANMGGYRHPGNHTGLFLDGGLGYRLTLPVGLSLEAMAGLGYLHTVLDGRVFAPGPNGGVEAVTDLGRPAWMPSAAVGVGLDAGGLGLPGSRVFTRLQLFGQYPFNTYVLPHVALQVGLTWNAQ